MNAPLSSAPRTAPQMAAYWEGVAKHELRLPRCSVCYAWEWYPSAAGPACRDGHYEWEVISSGATVFTFTDVKRPLLPAVTDSYIVGLICPDDAPNCRIPSRIEGPVVIGAHARLAFSGSGDNSFPYYIIECAP